MYNPYLAFQNCHESKTIMFNNYHFTAAERFLRYVQIDTQSDPHSDTFPSSEKQKNLSKILLEELKAIGIADAELDEFGYVYATLPSNTGKQVPTICFCSHVDTAPDCSGTNVKPVLHKNYSGEDIVLPDDTLQVISTKQYPYLTEHIGSDIITASGLTLLGGDDKAGVAEIIDAANFLSLHPEVKHGEIKIVFTPDEEVGKGTAKIDLEKVNAQFAYTLDGGESGVIEDETFSADAVHITINGVISHPGYAKEKMVNALKIVGEIVAALPTNEWSPETTEGRQGFVHPVAIGGLAEKATADFLIRDFDTAMLAQHEAQLKAITEKVLEKHLKATMQFEVKEQYRNMKEIISHYPQLIDYAEEAVKRAGLQPKKELVRGGTDGSRLSFMGLPCPNLFTGMQAIHSRHEWIGVKDMNKAVETIVYLSQIWEEKA